MNTNSLANIYRVTKERSGLDIDGVVLQLKTALSKAWDSQTREFLLSLLNDAEALGALEEASPMELKRIEDSAKNYLGEGLKEAARRPVIESQNTAYGIGKRAAIADFSFTQADLNALDILRDQTLIWVRDSYENMISAELHTALNDYFKQGLTRLDLADRLEELLIAKKRPKMLGYFDLLADHVGTRVAEMGHVAGYEEAGIEYVEVVAVLDDKTSAICRHMHGRVLETKTLSNQRDLLLDAAKSGDFNAAKSAQPMLSGNKAKEILSLDKTSDITGKGIALPPYHFRCRTTTVAYFEPATYHEKAKRWAIDGEIPSNEQKNLIDYAQNARWGTHPVTWHKSYGGDGEKHPTSFVHYKKHASDLGIKSMEEYNNAAMNLIRSGSRDVYLAIKNKEHPYPVLLFHNPKTRELAIVNIKGQNIASYYIIDADKWHKRIEKQEILLKLKGGLMKWIQFALS